MDSPKKSLLIVDDSEIDREILKNILHEYFELAEAVNGYYALEIIESGNIKIDAILLDVQMPFLDGFEVMKNMHKKGIDDIPVFLVTSEATTYNIHKAARYKFLANFIKKPFERDYILEKLGKMFNIAIKPDEPEPEAKKSHPIDNYKRKGNELSGQDISETNFYITRLKNVYNKFLSNNKLGNKKYERISGAMKLLLYEYAKTNKKTYMREEHIDIISDAVYFYNIGIMTIPAEIIKKQKRTEKEEEIYQGHYAMGASIVQLNSSLGCNYFVHRCSDICMYHGAVYNDGIVKDENDIIPQLAAVLIEFDRLIMERPEISGHQFKYVIKELDQKYGTAIGRIKGIFTENEEKIIEYYRKR